MRLLLDVDRRVVTLGLLAPVFGGIVVASLAVDGATAALRADDPVETIFQALVGATVAGVTLVLTPNQPVLSQELGAVGGQRSRMRGAVEFREDVGDLLGETPPTEPAASLWAVLSETGESAPGDALLDDDGG